MRKPAPVGNPRRQSRRITAFRFSAGAWKFVDASRGPRLRRARCPSPQCQRRRARCPSPRRNWGDGRPARRVRPTYRRAGCPSAQFFRRHARARVGDVEELEELQGRERFQRMRLQEVEFHLRPDEKRIADEFRQRRLPGRHLLRLGSIAGDKPFGNAANAHRTVLVGIRLHPDLVQRTERRVGGQRLRIEMVVPVNDRQILHPSVYRLLVNHHQTPETPSPSETPETPETPETISPLPSPHCNGNAAFSVSTQGES